MSDEQPPDDEARRPDSADSPWWSGSERQVWSSPPEDRERDLAAEPAGLGWPTSPSESSSTSSAAGATQVTERIEEPRDPWALTDTLGTDDDRPRRSRAGALVALAAVLALLAGLAGGAVGYLLAERDGGTLTVDGANLGSAPARSVDRPAGSVPGVAAAVLPSVVQIKVQTSEGRATGSGFVVDENGLVVTNNHVVDGVQGKVTLTFNDGSTTQAQVVGKSASYDIAVLRLSAKNLPALALGNSDAVVVGDTVVAIGSPLGLSGTVTSGIVSAKDRPVTAGGGGAGGDSAYINAIQTDAAINPGNSGGPLVNLDGEVIGVNSAIATIGGSLGGESGNIGVGFAIPINQVRRTVEQIIDTGKAEFPIIGASLDGRYDGDGAQIATAPSSNGTPPIVTGGPADQAGLKAGDVILEIDGKTVAGSSELIVAIRSHRPGDVVDLTVRRGGQDKQVKVTLGSTQG